jgi:hypothetical protein
MKQKETSKSLMVILNSENWNLSISSINKAMAEKNMMM